MKKKGLMNKKVISAMTIGISAMLALQTPITAYANGNGEGQDPQSGNDGNNQGTEQQQTGESAPTDSSIVEAANQTAAQEPTFEQTVTAATEKAEEAQAECIGPNPEGTVAYKEVQDAGNIILNGDSSDPENVVPAAGSEVISNDKDKADAASDAIADLKKAADDIVTTKDKVDENGNAILDEEGNNVQDLSAVAGIQSAGAEIGEAKDILDELVDADKAAQDAYDEAYVKGGEYYANAKENDPQNPYDDTVESFGTAIEQIVDDESGSKGIVTTLNDIDTLISETDSDAATAILNIQNAASQEELEQAKQNFDNLMSTNIGTLEEWIASYGDLYDRFVKAEDELNKAQARLDTAESKYIGAQNTLGGKCQDAKNNVIDAQADVEAAEKKVQALDYALTTVEGLLPAEADPSATALAGVRGDNNWAGKFGNKDIVQSRLVMWDVLKYYYIPQVLGRNIIIDETVAPLPEFSHKSFSGQNGEYERNYTTVEYSYYDENGDIQTEVKYFNWDSIAKKDTANQNIYNTDTPESGTGIVIYEKSEQEVNSKWAEEKAWDLISHVAGGENDTDGVYVRNNNSVTDSKNKKRCIEQGMLKLYTYTDENGELQYITEFELFGGYPPLVMGLEGTYEPYNKGKDLQGNLTQNPDFMYEREDGTIGFRSPYLNKVFDNLTYVDPTVTVVQNQNALYRGENANCLIIGDNATIADVLKGQGNYVNGYVYSNVTGPDAQNFDKKVLDKLIEDNRKFNDYITANSLANVIRLKNQYDAYRKEVDEAKDAVDNAKGEIETLSTAIDTVKTGSQRQSKTKLAREVLGVASLSTYLGVEVSSNDLTMVELISELSGKKAEWNQKKADAESKLEEYEQLKDDAADDYQEALDALTGGEGGEGGGTTTDPTNPTTDRKSVV